MKDPKLGLLDGRLGRALDQTCAGWTLFHWQDLGRNVDHRGTKMRRGLVLASISYELTLNSLLILNNGRSFKTTR